MATLKSIFRTLANEFQIAAQGAGQALRQ